MAEGNDNQDGGGEKSRPVKKSLAELELHEIDWLHPEQYLEDDDGDDPLLPEQERAPERWLELCSRIDRPLRRRRRGEDAALLSIDRYVIDEVLGLGGMGMVVRGWDPNLARYVAIKLCLNPGAEAESVLRREAMTLAHLRHPNIVAVHDVGHFEDKLYMVMDFVEGYDGREWLGRWVSVDEVRRVFCAAIRGLDGAHRAGVLHGDFKPSNLLVGMSGEVLVSDFGVAEFMGLEDSGDDAEGQRQHPGGTRAFMAPERLLGHRGDERSDQFSVCVSMWVALHGTRPYAGKTADELLASIERGELRYGNEIAKGGLPAALEQAVLRGLRLDPDARHPTMDALLEAIADPQLRYGGESTWRQRWVHAAWMAGVMVVSCALSLGGMGWAMGRPPASELLAEVGHGAAVRMSAQPTRWRRDKAHGEAFVEERLRVGAALLERGERAIEDDPKLAAELAKAALSVARSAETELRRYGQPTQRADQLVEEALSLRTQALQ